jgi:hypothetical protein
MEVIVEKDELKEIKRGKGRVGNKEISKETILETTVGARVYK